MKAIIFALLVLIGVDLAFNHGAGLHRFGQGVSAFGDGIGAWVYYS